MVDLERALVPAKLAVKVVLALPWYLISSVFVSNRPKPTWSYKRSVLMQVMRIVVGDIARYGIIDGGTHEKLKLGRGVLGTYVEATLELVVGKLAAWAASAKVEPISIPGYWIHGQGVDVAMGEKPERGEKVIYYLHGGGYVCSSAHPSSFAMGLPRDLLAQSGGERIKRSFSIEYRLAKPDYAPENAPNHGPFPAALLDALAGYNYLVNKVGFRPQDVILVGDSAGGNLALALSRYLVECRDGGVWATIQDSLAPPGAIMLISPWSDLSDSHALEGSYVTNAATDMLEHNVDRNAEHHSAAPRYFLTSGQLEAEPEFYSNPYISPASRRLGRDSINFKGFPKALICGGGAEMFRDQIRELKNRMVADMGESMVEYSEPPDAVHDYCVMAWHEPERGEFFELARKWLAALP